MPLLTASVGSSSIMSVLFVESSTIPPPAAGDGERSTALLAHALTAFEQRFEADRPETVVLNDDSDTALAAALVALKLLIPVESTLGARDAPTANGRLIGQLAGAYTPAA